jgi:hypothetical protein
MTAINHALTGAVIGLVITNPVVALPLAFVSHFVCDAIPHYDMPGTPGERIVSSRLIREQIIGGALLCFLLVVVLYISQPVHWWVAALGAFLAASPDLLWIPRWLEARRTGVDPGPQGWFRRFHAKIQWKTGPKLIWLEAIWFVGFIALLSSRIA